MPVTTPTNVPTVHDIRAGAVIANIVDVDASDTSRA